MTPKLTKIETAYFTSFKEIVEFFYTENEDGTYNIEIKTEAKISFDELCEMRKDFDERIHPFKKDLNTLNVKYTIVG